MTGRDALLFFLDLRFSSTLDLIDSISYGSVTGVTSLEICEPARCRHFCSFKSKRLFFFNSEMSILSHIFRTVLIQYRYGATTVRTMILFVKFSIERVARVFEITAAAYIEDGTIGYLYYLVLLQSEWESSQRCQ